MSTGPRHGVLLLAAGGSRRLGQAKQLLLIEGETLVHRTARIALDTTPADAVLMLGAQAEAVANAVADLRIRGVTCHDWTQGMGASLRDGLAALSPDCDAALVLLCDQPGLDAAHLQAMVTAWRQAPAQAVASAYDGVLGVPALLPRDWFPALAALQADRGARDLLRERAATVIAIAAPALSQDIDTADDLHAASAFSALGADTKPE